MAGLRPTNLSSFEPEQQRVIEDIYKHLSGEGGGEGKFGAANYIGGSGGGAASGTFLRQDKNLSDLDVVDEAQENLNLKNKSADLDLNSISIEGTDLFPDKDPQNLGTGDEVTHKKLTATDEVDVDGVIRLHDSDSDISTDTFASGFAGTGIAFLNDGTWDGTLDNLTVRQRMRVYELLINQIRATNGSLVVTSAAETGRKDDLGFSPVEQLGGALDWTSSDPFWTESDQYWYPTYRVYIEENKFVPFVEEDLVIAQRFTGSSTYLVEGTVINIENGSGTVTDNSTRRYFDINITADSDVPTAGMDFVRWGNLSDADRQGVLYLTSDDDDAPYLDVVYGIDSHSKRNTQDTIKGRYGRLDGIIDSDFPTLDGSQTNLFGSYIDGGYFNNVEIVGTLKVLSDNDDAFLVDVPNLKIDSENETISVGDVFDADGNAKTGRIASSYFNDRYIWGPKPSASDPADPTPTDIDDLGYRFDAQTGEAYIASNIQLLYMPYNVADIDTFNSSASQLDNDYWEDFVGTTNEETVRDLNAKIRVKFQKKLGMDTIMLSGFGGVDNTTKSGVTHENRIGARVILESIDEFESFSTAGPSFFRITLDISTLTDDQYYEIEVYCESEVTIESGASDGSQYSSETKLREDVVLLAMG